MLHARHVRLGNDAGAVEALDAGDVDVEALSEGVGPHPLFDGVHTVTVAGLVAEPVVEERDGMARITAPGLTVELRGATVQRAGRVVTVRLR